SSWATRSGRSAVASAPRTTRTVRRSRGGCRGSAALGERERPLVDLASGEPRLARDRRRELADRPPGGERGADARVEVDRRAPGRRTRDDDRHLAAEPLHGADPRAERGEAAAQELLVRLRELAPDDGLAVAERPRRRGEEGVEPPRRLEEDERPGL